MDTRIPRVLPPTRYQDSVLLNISFKALFSSSLNALNAGVFLYVFGLYMIGMADTLFLDYKLKIALKDL